MQINISFLIICFSILGAEISTSFLWCNWYYIITSKL